MPKKREDPPQARPKANGVIEGAGEVVEQRITRTLEENYMPYAMSVILSRAIPEIDGLSLRIESSCIPCTKWGYWARPAPNQQTLWDRR